MKKGHQIAKLVSDGLLKEALFFYSHFHSRSFRPGKFTFPSLLKACAKLKAIPQGQMLHSHLLKTGFHADIYTATALTDMYIKFHLFDVALQVFDDILEPNLTSLNVVISGFSRNGCYREAFRIFQLVATPRLRPDSVTIVALLSACENVKHGYQLHCWAIKIGVEPDVYTATSLVTMYSNCRELIMAAKAFEQIPDKSMASYNAFISGLVQNGDPSLALDVFKDIRKLVDQLPNSLTLISVFSACSDLKCLQFGRQVHGFIVKVDASFATTVGNALLDMYSKCGCWIEAYDIFKELNSTRDLITWNSLIAGMMSNGQCEYAIQLFAELESEGLKPDSTTWNSMISGFSHLGKQVEAFLFFKKMQSASVTPSLKSITSLLQACSAMPAVRCGREIHAHAVRTDISGDGFIATALIGMYMKCGRSYQACKVFNQFEKKSNDPAIWNAMISGYGRNSEDESAFQIFSQMLKENVQPNSVTFMCILSVCSHSGHVAKGREIFRLMNVGYGLKPTWEHFGCMVDLLARSGHLVEARELLQEISEPSGSVLASLLGASECYSDSKLGEEMAERLLELEPENTMPYVLLSNIYAGQGRWKDVERVRDIMNQRQLKKLPAFSLIGVT